MSEAHKSHSYYIAGQQIWKVVPPIFIILGTLGNILSIVVLNRKNLRRTTTSFYLTVLAISDIMILYSGLLRQWILAMYQIDIRHSNPFMCKVNFFSVYFFADLTGWILVAVTLERVFLVWHPHSGKRYCSRASAAVVCTIIVVSLVAFNGHILYGMGEKTVTENNDTVIKRCTRRDSQYEQFFFRTWPWIDMTKYCIAPFLLLLIGNSLIIAKILYNRRKLRMRIGTETGPSKATQKKTSSMTALLFTLNAVYLTTSTPISVYLLKFDGWADPGDTHGMALASLLWALSNILMYANNTFNFVLYCLSGQNFRNEVKTLFCKKKHQVQGTTMMTLTERVD
ncbi:hypothetical protein FSP39_001315 [Pinctada imbricata]|uniref:G-protein coupled receptors family 1 profile domain-containing protein n=1 Tax=Pinctada imbricata TaxID=66713 RepID=A0AA88YH08_PINIB|nr:hypothetical protein FSP39_001315 [Pinctada imbricata]